MDPVWVREIPDLCARRQVPFFFKQWGGVRKKAAGRLLDDRTYDEMPLIANRGQLPTTSECLRMIAEAEKFYAAESAV